MTPEKSLLVRVFASLSTGSTSTRDLSDGLPVLTVLALKVQLLFKTCLNWVQKHASGLPRVPGVGNDEDDEDKWEEEIMDRVFVLSEMLQLGAYLDFSDEMGRRGIVKLVREYCFPCTLHVFKVEWSLIEGLCRGDVGASNFTRSTCLTLPQPLAKGVAGRCGAHRHYS